MPEVPKPSQAEAANAAKRSHHKKPATPDSGDVMSIETAAAHLGVKIGRLRILLKEGRLKAATNESTPQGVASPSVVAYLETRGQRLAKPTGTGEA